MNIKQAQQIINLSKVNFAKKLRDFRREIKKVKHNKGNK